MHHKQLIALLLLLLLTACGRHRQANALLSQADSLMASWPDSAYALLTAVTPDERSDWRRADRMRYELTLAEAMNKAYKDFTTDSVLQLVVRYYDRHGSANQQLKAHYLLGCAYRDMGEAPMAINAYQEAVEKADTLSKDCDYKTLSCVYSQISDIFHDQLTLSNAIQCRHRSIEYSYRSGDTLTALYDYTRMAADYILLGVNDSAEKVLLKARDSYIQYGREKDWALFSSPLIYLYLRVPGHLSDVKELLDAYEKNSGISRGDSTNIPNIRSYYKFKGQYYEQTGQLDSAEFFFRKLQQKSLNFMQKDPLFRGLAKVFSKKHMTDSVAKYVFLYGEANDSSIAIKDREIMAKMAATYNYSRAQQDASVQRAKALRNTHRLIIVSTISFALLAIFLSIILWYRRWQRQKQAELQRLEGELQRTKREFDNNQIMLGNLDFIYHEALRTIKAMGLEQTRTRAEQEETVSELKRRFSESEKALQATIKNQSTQIEVLEQRLGRLATSKEQESIFSHPFIAHIIEVARKPDVELNQDEWNRLMEIWRGYYPKLSADLLANTEVTKQGMRVCLLTSLFLRGKDIANLFNVTSGRITNLKSDVNEAMFGKKDARALLPNLVAFYHIQQPYEADNTTKV